MDLSGDDIQPELDRRRPGQSKITTHRNEADQVEILSGVFEGKTTGTPIALSVFNKDQKSKDYSNMKDLFRPSHADYTYHARYGHRAYPGGGRSSARATIGVVAAGAVARKLLKEQAGVEIAAYVRSIHNLTLEESFLPPGAEKLRELVESNIVRCPDKALAEKMERLILDTAREGDSLGGVVELVVQNMPAGLGAPLFGKLDADLAAAMINIPASKGVEFGSGFAGSQMKGSEHNDIFYNDKGQISTHTNYSGGVQGGISNGMDLVLRVAFKPTATILREQETVDKEGKETTFTAAGRHDPCVLPRAVPIVEAAAALVLADHYLLQKSVRF